MTERYHGIKINMERATDEEVMGVLDHSLERLYKAEDDVRRAMGHAAARKLLPEPRTYAENVIPFPVSQQLEIEYESEG